jgi:hypothetical protein
VELAKTMTSCNMILKVLLLMRVAWNDRPIGLRQREPTRLMDNVQWIEIFVIGCGGQDAGHGMRGIECRHRRWATVVGFHRTPDLSLQVATIFASSSNTHNAGVASQVPIGST